MRVVFHSARYLYAFALPEYDALEVPFRKIQPKTQPW
jgi:hypothetical protein